MIKTRYRQLETLFILYWPRCNKRRPNTNQVCERMKGHKLYVWKQGHIVHESHFSKWSNL